jgi:hypothetical protein
VLDNKIRHGPDEVDGARTTTTSKTILNVAGLRAGTGGASLTEPEGKEREWPPWI